MIDIALSKQVHIYSVDTNNFYFKSEDEIHGRMINGYNLRSRVKKRRKDIHKLYYDYQEQLKEQAQLKGEDFDKNEAKNIHQSDKDYIDAMYLRVNKLIKKYKNNLQNDFMKNSGKIRVLKDKELNDRKVISVFDSALTRTIGIKEGELSDDLIVVQTFFFEIFKELVLNGFMWSGEKYIIYTASAGQIRTKKTVFIKEKVWELHKNTITCGMTDDIINKRGMMNINKFLAYKALQNSATEEWFDFDISKAIVVRDFESDVTALVDKIDDETYKIERKEMPIPIPHTDGAGMILPSICKNTRITRLPWIKGLLIPFDFKEFLYKYMQKDKINYGNIKDIYGNEYDIIRDDIQVIFTESQFKMHKFYKNWQEYQRLFVKHNCQAGYCDEEDTIIKDARINYQMLQTLSDMTDKELKEVSKKTNSVIKDITNDKKTMMKLMGVTKFNQNKNYYQQAIQYYPQLLNDAYSKYMLRQIKRSTVKRAKAGKLFIDAKYTFICPDLYAFSENLFLGLDNPKGLLKDGEVSCSLYDNNEELDCLRSPHLFLEHAVRKNKTLDIHKKWFITKGLYTSCNDVISKILQFDVDGDKSLVCRDKTIVKAAKRNVEKYDIVPLYYDMRGANTTTINPEEIYKGLTDAYKGGNIGIISNDISKIWNSEYIDINAVKYLCMENNFIIDYAKTLHKPTRPNWAKRDIVMYTREKLPHFFKYAKDKSLDSVCDENQSVVNRLSYIIENPNLDFKSACGRFRYKNLMNNPKFESVESDAEIIGAYEKLEHRSTFMINRSDGYHKVLNAQFVYGKIKAGILDVCNDPIYVTDVLIDYLYRMKKENKKITLWECFGDIIVENIKNNTTKGFKYDAIECKECGILIERVNGRLKYCHECAIELNKKNTQKNMRKIRSYV